jgi:uncharacterized damage-inducible protein DinB
MQQPKTAPTGDYSRFSTSLLLQAYSEGPARLRRVLEGLSEDDLKARPRGAESWSAHEIVLHLADAEIIGATRTRQAITQSDPHFPVYDQDVWTSFFDYQSRGADERAEALALFEALRRSTTRLFDRAGDADWQKTGLHPERGPLTLRQVLELYADHSERHIEQILRIRRLLGKPIGFPLLLDVRLY